MSNPDKKTPLLGMTLEQLKEVAPSVGLKPFAAKQMARWLYEKRVTSIDEMTDLSKIAREKLAENYEIGRRAPIHCVTSADGTKKYLFEARPGRPIEAVYIPDRDRATLCVSSQAGCKMNCQFCATGRGGFQGSLTAGEIINQILSIPESDTLTNIVFMGMGEPADNLEGVLPALEILTEKWGLAWSPRRITVSSVGKLDGMRQILDNTKVHIALSLHTPFPGRRADIMPVEKAYPLNDVLDLLKKYDFSHQRRLSFEYIMWNGVNDDSRHARALARILHGLDCRVNLIRYHALTPDDPLQPSNNETMVRFRDLLNDSGITATIRASRGEDIDAACGMLAGKQNK